MTNGTDSGLKEEIEKLELEFKKVDLERKISECKKKKTEAEDALEPSEIEQEKERAELEKQIAEAEKDTLKAKLPDSEVKPLEGKLTVDNEVAIECQIMTYKAMSEIAVQISKEIGKKGKSNKVIICDQSDINAFYSYRAFKEQISILIDQYKKELEHKIKEMENKELLLPTAVLTESTALLKSIIDFASFFRTDIEIKGKKVNIETDALIAEVSNALKSNNIATIYPAFKTTAPVKFLMDISELSNLKLQADQKIKDNADNEQKIMELKGLNDQYTKLLTTLTSIDEKTGNIRLEKILLGEMLNSEFNEENNETGDITDILYLKSVIAGGNNQVKRRLWWTKLSHSGGAIITYFLIDKEGNIKLSKNYYNLIGYNTFKNSGTEISNNNF